MASTVIPFGDPKAAKKWSASLAVDQVKKSYFERKFVGTDENSIIQRKTELESDSGDRISFDLSVQLRGEYTAGDRRLEGKEESLKFYTDEVYIDQARKAVSGGGKMTRKRTVHNIRKIARDRLGDYWSRFMDELTFIYLSGARGINADFLFPTSFAGHAGNSLQAPDAGHLLIAGAGTKGGLSNSDKMTRIIVERAAVMAKMLQAQDPEAANMVPVTVEGEEHYCLVMSEFQAYDLRTSTSGGEWLDIQKAAAGAEGRNNKIFKGGLGMINNVILHSHRNVIRFDDYGPGSPGTLAASRALFLGRQAGAVAYGTSGGLRFTWEEELKDYGNEPTVASGTIFGLKKTRFNNRDFGVISIDTYAADPNA